MSSPTKHVVPQIRENQTTTGAIEHECIWWTTFVAAPFCMMSTALYRHGKSCTVHVPQPHVVYTQQNSSQWWWCVKNYRSGAWEAVSYCTCDWLLTTGEQVWAVHTSRAIGAMG
jgi:hypothetical protein